MRRYELADDQWSKIANLFPSNVGKRGGQWLDHHMIMNGMYWVLCSGAPWRDLTERYGKRQTVYDQFRDYRTSGFF